MCDHDSGLTKKGEMESTKLDQVYVIPFECDQCKKTVYELYHYEGIIDSKDEVW